MHIYAKPILWDFSQKQIYTVFPNFLRILFSGRGISPERYEIQSQFLLIC